MSEALDYIKAALQIAFSLVLLAIILLNFRGLHLALEKFLERAASVSAIKVLGVEVDMDAADRALSAVNRLNLVKIEVDDRRYAGDLSARRSVRPRHKTANVCPLAASLAGFQRFFDVSSPTLLRSCAFSASSSFNLKAWLATGEVNKLASFVPMGEPIPVHGSGPTAARKLPLSPWVMSLKHT